LRYHFLIGELIKKESIANVITAPAESPSLGIAPSATKENDNLSTNTEDIESDLFSIDSSDSAVITEMKKENIKYGIK
jgi:hypothetical protein